MCGAGTEAGNEDAAVTLAHASDLHAQAYTNLSMDGCSILLLLI